MGGLIDGLRDGIAYIYGLEWHQSQLKQDCLFYQLEGHQLRFNPCRCRWLYKDVTQRAGADNNRCTRAGGDNFRRCNSIPRPPRLDCQRQRLILHLQVLVPAVPLSGLVADIRLRPQLRLPPTRLLQRRYRPSFQIQLGIS